jgi:hypothetical protein
MPLGAAIGLVTALHDLHGEWDLIFSNPPWVARPLHTLCPLVTTSVMRAFDTQHIVLIYCVQVPMTCPGLPLQLLWRTLTDERLDLCESVKSVPVCEDIVHMGVDAALASRYQLCGQDLIVCGSVVWPWGSSPPLVSPWLDGSLWTSVRPYP